MPDTVSTKPKVTEVAIVAAAMAEAMHTGEGDVPERDIRIYHEPATLFLAAQTALANAKTEAAAKKPEPVTAKPVEVPKPVEAVVVPAPAPATVPSDLGPPIGPAPSPAVPDTQPKG